MRMADWPPERCDVCEGFYRGDEDFVEITSIDGRYGDPADPVIHTCYRCLKNGAAVLGFFMKEAELYPDDELEPAFLSGRDTGDEDGQ